MQCDLGCGSWPVRYFNAVTSHLSAVVTEGENDRQCPDSAPIYCHVKLAAYRPALDPATKLAERGRTRLSKVLVPGTSIQHVCRNSNPGARRSDSLLHM